MFPLSPPIRSNNKVGRKKGRKGGKEGGKWGTWREGREGDGRMEEKKKGRKEGRKTEWEGRREGGRETQFSWLHVLQELMSSVSNTPTQIYPIPYFHFKMKQWLHTVFKTVFIGVTIWRAPCQSLFKFLKWTFSLIQQFQNLSHKCTCINAQKCLSKVSITGASLVAQWLKICLPMQGTRVRALVWEDPTHHGATGPVSHNYWACASGACAPQQERQR